MNRAAFLAGVALCSALVAYAAYDANASSAKRVAAAPGPDRQSVQVPTERTYEVAGGLLTVIDVPIAGLKMATERQTCYLWRDGQQPTVAQLQCPNDQRTYTLDPPER